MEHQEPESLEKIRQQFESSPYPRSPLEQSPKEDYNLLFVHSLVTAYYLRDQTVISTQGKTILDAGCGTGYKALTLAEANPGAHIVGVDLSQASVNLAYKRLDYYGFKDTEFHALPIEDLPKLGMKFDYINCDEVLYLLPDPLAGLKAMKAVLKPEGILRCNLHSFYQRIARYRAQKLFKLMGLMDQNPEAEAINVVVETMKALKDNTMLKAQTWLPIYEKPDGGAEILCNHLLVGDKGSTVVDLFALLAAADLEFISMVNWRHWDVADLFKEPDDLPAIWAMSLTAASIQERLHLYELLHPVNRLLDCWCTHPDSISSPNPLDTWTDDDWQTAQFHLHPLLQNESVKTDLINCVTKAQSFEISAYITLPALGPVMVQSILAACLLPLWDGPQTTTSLVERYCQILSHHPVTLEPITPDFAFIELKRLMGQLSAFLYVLPERSVSPSSSIM
jgi:ubiquinone/menaquinone biosynthesis C-methylase UbiE